MNEMNDAGQTSVRKPGKVWLHPSSSAHDFDRRAIVYLQYSAAHVYLRMHLRLQSFRNMCASDRDPDGGTLGTTSSGSLCTSGVFACRPALPLTA